MGSNHMNEHFRRMKKEKEIMDKIEVTKPKLEIPTHDPFTGELNPYYEELTGKKNPLSK
jgi:hypothetical protein